MDIYRVTNASSPWLIKAYDFVRTDAFCYGQGIPVELEFAGDDPEEALEAVVIIEDHKPVAGARITFPEEGIGKIGRVCVARDRQKSGIGRILIEEAEKWIQEHGAKHIVISSQDRAAGFYEKCGYVINPNVDPDVYEHHSGTKTRPAFPASNDPYPTSLGFRCVLVEKYL